MVFILIGCLTLLVICGFMDALLATIEFFLRIAITGICTWVGAVLLVVAILWCQTH